VPHWSRSETQNTVRIWGLILLHYDKWSNSLKRKQSKSLPWRRFGYVILIIKKFCELLLWISLTIIYIINTLRSSIRHLKARFIGYPNTSKLVKKSWLCLIVLTHFSVFGYLINILLVFDIFLETSASFSFNYSNFTLNNLFDSKFLHSQCFSELVESESKLLGFWPKNCLV